MKRLLNLLRHYKLFSLAVAVFIGGLILQLLKQRLIAHWLIDIVSITELLIMLWQMWQDLRLGKYGINILAAVAVITSVVLHQYWAAIVLILILTGSALLEDFAKSRAKNELNYLLEHAPKKANLVKKGKSSIVLATYIKSGDKIIIKAGEIVPVDCLLIEGSAGFDESALTGESLPQTKLIGDPLLCGSINLGDGVIARAVATAEDSHYQQIVRLVRGASSAHAPFVRLTDRLCLPFTFLVLGIALVALVFTGQTIRFLDIIIVATPLPLILAAPLAITSGMARASRYGIIIRNGLAMERLAHTRTIAFNKTGTLTRSQMVVSDIVAIGKYSKEEVLQLAAGLEQTSNHLVAKAIIAAAVSQKLKINKAKHVQEDSTLGLRAIQKGQEIMVGRLTYLTDAVVKIAAKPKAKQFKQTAVYVAADGELAGIITLSDKLRPDAEVTFQSLAVMGVRETILITGDNAGTAKEIASNLGIKTVHSEMLAIDKIHIVEKIRSRPFVFVGNGVDDASLLNSADVGVALGAISSTAAAESADILIMPNNLSRVVSSMIIAKRSFKIARQSILAGIGLSIALMAAFATGKFSPLEGAFLQAIVDLFVVFNALRAHLIDVGV